MLSIVLFSHGQSSSANLKQFVSLLIPILFAPREAEATPGETQFFTLKFIEESFLSKNVCLHVTKGRRSDHGSCILNYHAPDSNLEHPTL